MSEKPDEIVARNILAELLQRGLIAPEIAEEFSHGLVVGSLSSEDWRKAAELSVRPTEGCTDA